MPRPVWSGTISFGLVAIPVKLYSAVNSKSIAFNQLDDRTMERIRLKKVSGATGEEVPPEHIIKGYEISDGQYVVVDMDELEPLLPVATKTIDLEEFVDLDEIDPVYFDSPYIVAPDKTPKPYVLLAKAMEEAGKVAIGRFVMRNKQYVAALRAQDGKLLMSTMVFADEVIDPGTIDDIPQADDVEVRDREVDIAKQLVESLSSEFEPDKFRDTYRDEVLALIERKASGEEIAVQPARDEAAEPVPDLMAALRASLDAVRAGDADEPAPKPKKRPAAKSKAKSSGRKPAAAKKG